MIANITNGKNYYGLLVYHQDKVDKQEAKVIYEHHIVDNRPRELHNYLDSFSRYSNTKKPVFHASLSFPKQDLPHLSDEALNKISQDYLDKMGYGEQPYIIYRHYDRAHPHVHIVSTRVNIETTKSIPSKFEGRRSQKITESLEKKYKLTIAKFQTKNHEEIQVAVNKALQKAPVTINALNKNLAKNNADFRVKIIGKGMVYYKVDEQGKKNSKTWKSSDFKNIGLDRKGLEKQFSINQADRKHLKKEISTSLKFVIQDVNKAPKLFDRLEKQLEQKGIQVQLHQNDKNDKGVYGWSFQYQNKSFKASDIDKSLSWNQWKIHLQTASKIQDKPINQSVLENRETSTLEKNIEVSIKGGEKIKINFKDNRYQFDTVGEQPSNSSLNKTLNPLVKQLNTMDNEDAYQIAKIHNKHLEDYKSAPSVNDKNLISKIAGEQGEDYVQRQIKIRQRQQEKSLRKNR